MCDTRPPHIIKKTIKQNWIKNQKKMTNISKHKAAATLGHMNVWHELRHKLKGDCFYFFRNCTLKPPRSFVRHSQQIFVFNFSVFRLYRCFQEGFLKTGEQLRHSSTAPSERRRQRGDGGTGWSDIWTAQRDALAWDRPPESEHLRNVFTQRHHFCDTVTVQTSAS